MLSYPQYKKVMVDLQQLLGDMTKGLDFISIKLLEHYLFKINFSLNLHLIIMNRKARTKGVTSMPK